MELIDAYKAEKGYKSDIKVFPADSVRYQKFNVIKKCQLRETVEVNAWKMKKTLRWNCLYDGQKGKAKSTNYNNYPLEGTADSKVVVKLGSFVCMNMTCMEESSEGKLTWNLIIKVNDWNMQNSR